MQGFSATLLDEGGRAVAPAGHGAIRKPSLGAVSIGEPGVCTCTGVIVGALVGATWPGSAEAQVSGIEVGLGGFLNEYLALTTVDEAEGDDRDFNEVTAHFEGEIFFQGKAALENGIEFGVEVQMEVPTNGDQIDEAFMFVNTGFGQFILGGENMPAYKMGLGMWEMGVGVPINSGWISDFIPPPPGFTAAFRSPAMSTAIDVINDDNSFSYYTPRVGGFQFGGGFAPSASFNGNPQNGPVDKDGFTYRNAVSFGLNFVETFGGLDVGASAGYARAQSGDGVDDVGGDDIEQVMAGLTLGLAGFKLFGSYANELEGRFSQAGAVSTEGESYLVGLNYAFDDSWSAGVAYRYGEVEGDRAIGGDDELQAASFSISYKVGPGIKVATTLLWADWERDSGESTDGVALAAGFGLSF